MRFVLLLVAFLLTVGIVSAQAQPKEEQPEDSFYFVVFLDLFPSPFGLFNLLDFGEPQDKEIQPPKLPIESEPDFSGYFDAKQCEDVPEFWKVDCLNSVIVNLQNRLNNLEDSVVNLANDSAYMFRLQFFGTYAFVISVLVFLAIFLCCCTTKKEQQAFQGKQFAADVPYVVLRPVDNYV